MFWSEIGSGFGEPGGTPLSKIPSSTPGGLFVARLIQKSFVQTKTRGYGRYYLLMMKPNCSHVGRQYQEK